MTTKITVDAHAGWPVDVTTIDDVNGKMERFTERVPPNETRDFYVYSTRQLAIREVQPGEAPQPDRMIQFFAWAHLPPHLQEISRPFGELAQWMVDNLPMNPERTAGLRKLLEAKDCAVRARLFK